MKITRYNISVSARLIDQKPVEQQISYQYVTSLIAKEETGSVTNKKI